MGRRPGAAGHYCAWLFDATWDRATVGGKGASLGRLASLGAPVPPACAITTHAYLEVVRALRLPERAADISPAALEGIRDRILHAALPARVSATFDHAFERMEMEADGLVDLAVRSSATVEDAASWSFAGLHDTVLGVRSRAGLEEAARRCWASVWSERAVHYRLLAGLDDDRCAIAVVVQPLVRCDVSFVMFTANPLTGEEGEIVIVASWGLGEAVVSGLVTPDHIVVGPDGSVVSYEVGAKDRMIIPVERPGEGTREVAVPGMLHNVPALGEDQIAEIARIGRSLEASLGYPADIEGGIADGTLHILQARPITTVLGDSGRRNGRDRSR